MSTVISVVTVTTMQLKINTSNQKLVRELYEKIESDPNYPMIPSTCTNPVVDVTQIEHTKETPKEWHSSKLEQLLDHLLLMNTCLSNQARLSVNSHQNISSKVITNQFQNNTQKNITFFNYKTVANYTF